MAVVEDIMTRRVLTLDPAASLDDAAWGLHLKGVTGAPVRDEKGALIGVLSKSDLTSASLERGEDSPRTVRDAMTPVLFSARASDRVKLAVARMVATSSHRLVVTDDTGELVGIVTPMDVLRGLLEGRIDAEEFGG